MKVIVDIIPLQNRFYRFLSFLRNQKQESNFKQVGSLVTRSISIFYKSRVVFYFKAMSVSIDFYKGISLHVIPVRIIVPCRYKKLTIL